MVIVVGFGEDGNLGVGMGLGFAEGDVDGVGLGLGVGVGVGVGACVGLGLGEIFGDSDCISVLLAEFNKMNPMPRTTRGIMIEIVTKPPEVLPTTKV